MFIRSLDEKELENEEFANMTGESMDAIFPSTPVGQSMRWSKFKDKDPREIFDIISQRVFPAIKKLKNGRLPDFNEQGELIEIEREAEEDKNSTAFARYMEDAMFLIPTPQVLQKIISGLEDLYIHDISDLDMQGDLYEYMLGKLETAGKNGQFRTPRHIIEMMVKLIAPTPEDRICEGILLGLIRYNQEAALPKPHRIRLFKKDPLEVLFFCPPAGGQIFKNRVQATADPPLDFCLVNLILTQDPGAFYLFFLQKLYPTKRYYHIQNLIKAAKRVMISTCWHIARIVWRDYVVPNMRKLHAFANKWCDKFKDISTKSKELESRHMGEDCAALGFEMDGGQRFLKKYGEAAFNFAELTRVIENVNDIYLLGSVIYSRWRYFSHWAVGEDISSPRNREWFILALNRLAFLSEYNVPPVFRGKLSKIHIVSNKMNFERDPEPGHEVEQRLTINEKGRVWFSSFNYTECGKKHEKGKSRYFKICEESKKLLFDALSVYFSNKYSEDLRTDIGCWKMELTNTEGVVYKYRGSLGFGLKTAAVDLSELIRETLDMKNLFVFDGRAETDVIQKITVYYECVADSDIAIPGLAKCDCVAIDGREFIHRETLLIDRVELVLEHTMESRIKGRISHRYEGMAEIRDLLDRFDANDFFSKVEGNPPDVVDTANSKKRFTIKIEYVNKPQRVLAGSFDRKDLPEDYSEFARELVEFLLYYGLGEVLLPHNFSRVKRRRSEYIICSVAFDTGYRRFYYLTEDDSITAGDFVVVPVGKDDHEAIAEVLDVQYLSDKAVPVPIAQMKSVMRKHGATG